MGGGHLSCGGSYLPPLAAYLEFKTGAILLVWPCSGWGLPAKCCHHHRGELLPHHFTLARAKSNRLVGGVVSVVLSVEFPLLGFPQHPARWSPDFPPLLGAATQSTYHKEIYHELPYSSTKRPPVLLKIPFDLRHHFLT